MGNANLPKVYLKSLKKSFKILTTKMFQNYDNARDLNSKLELPLIVAPMFLISNPKLALASCKEGVVGSFPALNQRTSEGFEEWLIEMNDGIKQAKQDNPDKKIAPYAVNLIVHESNKRLEADLKLCVKYKVPVIITSLGAVSKLVDAVHGYGGIVIHDVTSVRHAKSAVRAGVDGLIAVGPDAGGHAGIIDPKTLITDIKKFFNGIILQAGGLTTGSDIKNVQNNGADFAYMGTRFINTEESAAVQGYKDMIGEATAEDIIYTDTISGVPANFMRQSLEIAGYNIEELKKSPKSDGKAKLKSLDSEADSWKNIWSAGKGVENMPKGYIPSVAKLVTKMKQEYQISNQNLKQTQKKTNKKYGR